MNERSHSDIESKLEDTADTLSGSSGRANDVLVSPDWVAQRLDRFDRSDTDYRLVEVDVNTAFYHQGHVPGAICLDWQRDLRASESHDIVGPDALEATLGANGITADTTVVVYGDNANWFATHFYWQLRYYGHPDVRIIDGGREYWLDHGYPLTTGKPDVPTVDYGGSLSAPANPWVRASRNDIAAGLSGETTFVDVRLPEEFRGDVTSPPGIDERAARGGHIPGAKNIFWAENLRPDMRFKSVEALRRLYRSYGFEITDDIVVYCRIGERSSITWFVLSELLGYEHVRNYDGSWTEWGNLVGVPIEVGDSPSE